jgi:hypothetical protein
MNYMKCRIVGQILLFGAEYNYQNIKKFQFLSQYEKLDQDKEIKSTKKYGNISQLYKIKIKY